MQNPYFKRQHHYIFAYYALRENVELRPAEVMQALMRDDVPFLLRLWELAGKTAVELREAEYLPPHGLEKSIHELRSGKKLVIVTLPTPVYGIEAYYIGFVTKVILLNSKKPKSLMKPRYFAYEFSKSPSQEMGKEPKFAFCEWGENGTRANMGFFQGSSKEAFIGLVLKNIGDELA